MFELLIPFSLHLKKFVVNVNVSNCFTHPYIDDFSNDFSKWYRVESEIQ